MSRSRFQLNVLALAVNVLASRHSSHDSMAHYRGICSIDDGSEQTPGGAGEAAADAGPGEAAADAGPGEAAWPIRKRNTWVVAFWKDCHSSIPSRISK